MFKISDAQIDSMKSQRLDTFVRKTVLHLQNSFSHRATAFTPDELDKMVRTAHQRGQRFAVTSAYDVERLSECLLLYGIDFANNAETQWALDILCRCDLTGRKKMTAISNYEAFSLRLAS